MTIAPKEFELIYPGFLDPTCSELWTFSHRGLLSAQEQFQVVSNRNEIVSQGFFPEEQEDTGLEEGDDDNELVEASETGKGSQSSKKKEPEPPVNEEGQAALFEPAEKPKQQVQKAAQQKPKVKVEQQDLFGAKPAPKEKSEKVIVKKKVDKPKPDSTAFDVGQTIELEL